MKQKLSSDAYKQKIGVARRLQELAGNSSALLAALITRLEIEATTGGPAKRPAGAPLDGPESKKQRMVADREQRRKAIWDECLKMVEKLLKNGHSTAFRQPVDIKALKIPDYYNHIKQPMDLGTVKRNLLGRVYREPGQMADDVRLVWDNCYRYNGDKHAVSLAAKKMSEMFERDWAKADVEQRWAVEVAREKREEQLMAGDAAQLPDDSLPLQMAELRNQLGEHIAATDHAAGVAPGAVFACEPHRDMSFEEKRKLSAYLSALPGEKGVAILDIIRESMEIPEGEEEVDLDMDALNNATLWRLREFVEACMQAGGGGGGAPPKKTTGVSRAPDKRPPGAPNKGAPATKAPEAATESQQPAATLAAAPVQAEPAPAATAPAVEAPAAPAAPVAAAAPPVAAAADTGPSGAMPPPQPPSHQPAAQPGSPMAADSDEDGFVGSTAQGLEMRGPMVPGFGDAGTVAQSGTNKPQPSAFVKSKPKGDGAGVNEAALNQEAWAAVGAEAANGDDAGAAGAAGAAEGGAAVGAGDEVWEEFSRKADKSLQELEEEKRQKEEEERQRKEAEENGRQEEEEAKRKLEEEEQEAERKRLAALEEEKQAQKQELEGMASKHLADADTGAMMAKELAPTADAAMQDLGMARRDDDDDMNFDDM